MDAWRCPVVSSWQSLCGLRQSASKFSRTSPLRRIVAASAITLLMSLVGLRSRAGPRPRKAIKILLKPKTTEPGTTWQRGGDDGLKEPEQVCGRRPAIYGSPRRIYGGPGPRASLRFCGSARIGGGTKPILTTGPWGYAGWGPVLESLLVLIDGRSVYSPLFSGVYWQVQTPCLKTSSESK